MKFWKKKEKISPAYHVGLASIVSANPFGTMLCLGCRWVDAVVENVMFSGEKMPKGFVLRAKEHQLEHQWTPTSTGSPEPSHWLIT